MRESLYGFAFVGQLEFGVTPRYRLSFYLYSFIVSLRRCYFCHPHHRLRRFPVEYHIELDALGWNAWNRITCLWSASTGLWTKLVIGFLQLSSELGSKRDLLGFHFVCPCSYYLSLDPILKDSKRLRNQRSFGAGFCVSIIELCLFSY